MKNEINVELLKALKGYNPKHMIIEPPKEPVMKDDGCGFGDLIACCPECEESFTFPLYWKGKTWVCSKCRVLLKTPYWYK